MQPHTWIGVLTCSLWLLTLAPPSASAASDVARVRRSLCTLNNGRLGEPGTLGTCMLPNEVTLILCVYRRKHLFAQLERAWLQTVRPKLVYIWQNQHLVDVRPDIEKAQLQFPGFEIKLIHFDGNFMYHGRFLLPLSFTTEFSCVWDDDILPGRRWLETSRNGCRATGGALIGGNGRFVMSLQRARQGPKGKKIVEQPEGDSCEDRVRLTKVDYVGHSWFFPTDHVRYLWDFPWLTWRTGEDMQFAFALQRHNISSYVAAQPTLEHCAHKTDLGKDRVASWHTARSTPVRPWLMAALRRSGFKTLRCRDCTSLNVVSAERWWWSTMMKYYKDNPKVLLSQDGHEQYFQLLSQDGHEQYFQQWVRTGAPTGPDSSVGQALQHGGPLSKAADTQNGQFSQWQLGLLLLLMVPGVYSVLRMVGRLTRS